VAELQERLRSDDPLRLEKELADTEIHRLRRAVLAASTPRPSARPLTLPILAAALSAILAGAVWLVRADPNGARESSARAVPSEPEGPDRRQLLFETRRGTRVIWVFEGSERGDQ
jgi:hypothetical protein